MAPTSACAAGPPRKADAFEQAALALTAVVTDPAGVGRARRRVEIALRGARRRAAAGATGSTRWSTRWRRAACCSAASTCELDGDRLHGRAWGEAVDVRAPPAGGRGQGRDLHGAARGAGADGGWLAQTVVDV